MKNSLPFAVVGILLGVFIAWLLGLFSPLPMTEAEPTAKTAAAPAKSPPVAPAVKTTPAAVAMPKAPPVKASEAAPKTMTPQQAAAMTTASAQIELKAKTKRAINNLRQISTAAQQYFLDKGVTSVGYYDLVGAGANNYVRNVSPVDDEDYSVIYINQSDTQISISGSSFGTVTYNQ